MTVYENVYHRFEKGFLGSCALGILVQSAIGGITAMAILENGNGWFQMVQLFLIVIACIAFNGSIISVQKPKVVFNLLIGSALLCVTLATLNWLL